MTTFTASGSYGTLTCDAETGDVLSYAPEDNEPACYHYIVRLDVEEWRKAYPERSLDGLAGDVLDFGYWTDTEDYGAPCKDWRGQTGVWTPDRG